MGAILEHLMKDHGATMAEAKSALSAWEIRPIEYDGIKVGEIMLQNNEVHMAMDKSERNKSGRRTLLYSYIKSLLKEKGFLVTRLFKHDKYNHKIKRLGFSLTHSDAQFNYYWLNDEQITQKGIKP